MQKLQISNNHTGKIFNNAFSIVELHDPLRFTTGTSLELFLDRRDMGIVTVAAVRTFRYNQISDVLSFLDAGKPAHVLAEMLRRQNPKEQLRPDSMLDHVVLFYLRRNLLNHAILLQEWWQEKVVQNPTQTSPQIALNF